MFQVIQRQTSAHGCPDCIHAVAWPSPEYPHHSLLRRHSLHAIATQLSPVLGCTGIELLKADTFDLHCFQTLTGTKMIMVVEPGTPDVDLLLKDTCAFSPPNTLRPPLRLTLDIIVLGMEVKS